MFLRPTDGRIIVKGRVSALLELGAGFHQDLTGRENIYLNASLLGLDEDETNVRFDDIVAFSELEDFIDMPVKHYSSGMYMRLGFSVAIHMQPDILIVDEILAVGDQGDYAVAWTGTDSEGDTSIFVRNFNADDTLKEAAILLEAEGFATGSDLGPSLAAVGIDGNFIVAWAGESEEGAVTFDLFILDNDYERRVISSIQALGNSIPIPDMAVTCQDHHFVFWMSREKLVSRFRHAFVPKRLCLQEIIKFLILVLLCMSTIYLP